MGEKEQRKEAMCTIHHMLVIPISVLASSAIREIPNSTLVRFGQPGSIKIAEELELCGVQIELRSKVLRSYNDYHE